MNKQKKYTILIADDESNILDMYSQVLAMAGFEVVLAGDGKDVIEKIKKMHGHQLDLILLDIIMPQIDGFDVLERLKKDIEFKHVPVIMLSNLNRQEDIDEAIRLGAKDFFVKVKTSPSQLVSKINNVLNKREHEY